jgi:hypothetical protein
MAYKTKMKMSKPVRGGKLSIQQKSKLKTHSAHHSVGHMNMMRKKMKAGKSFSKAHEETKMKLGC